MLYLIDLVPEAPHSLCRCCFGGKPLLGHLLPLGGGQEPRSLRCCQPLSGSLEDTRLWASLVAQLVENLPAMWEIRVWSPGGRKDPLEKGMTTYSSVVAWRIPWTEETGGLQSMGCKDSHITERVHPGQGLLAPLVCIDGLPPLPGEGLGPLPGLHCCHSCCRQVRAAASPYGVPTHTSVGLLLSWAFGREHGIFECLFFFSCLCCLEVLSCKAFQCPVGRYIEKFKKKENSGSSSWWYS